MRLAKLTALVAATLCVFTYGCADIGYYLQSMHGQLRIVNKQREISKILTDPTTDPSLRERLQLVLQIRDFASRELALPNNASYRSYADLQRPFVVWNVFATAEFSIQPIEWCFAFVGCVNYRGYFSKAEAESFAKYIAQQKSDVYIGGVPAYSTLGWFSDPILNTVVHYPEREIARIIFHELAHQIVYVKSDSIFNESFAVSVELEGLRRWLEQNGTPQQRWEFLTAQNYRDQFISLVLEYRLRLEKLYASDLDMDTMRIAKAKEFSDLKRDYEILKQGWNGYSGYDQWFSQDLNNAQIVSVSTYAQQVPAFQSILQQHGGDLREFYEEVKRLAKLRKEQRDAALAQYTTLLPR